MKRFFINTTSYDVISKINSNPGILPDIDWASVTDNFMDLKIDEIISGIERDDVCDLVCEYIEEAHERSPFSLTKELNLETRKFIRRLYRDEKKKSEARLKELNERARKLANAGTPESILEGIIASERKEAIEQSTATIERENAMMRRDMMWNEVFDKAKRVGKVIKLKDREEENEEVYKIVSPVQEEQESSEGCKQAPPPIESSATIEQKSSPTDTPIKIAKGKKSSVLLVLNAMYKAGWFTDKTGKALTNRDNALNEILMRALGEPKNKTICSCLNPSGSTNNETRTKGIADKFSPFLEKALKEIIEDKNIILENMIIKE